MLRIKARTVYEMASQNRNPFRKAGRLTVFLLEETLDWTTPRRRALCARAIPASATPSQEWRQATRKIIVTRLSQMKNGRYSTCRELLICTMRPARLERATFWFVAKRSIQLSYGRI